MSELLDFENIDMYDSERYYNDIFSAVAEDIKAIRNGKYKVVERDTGKGEAFFHVSDDFVSFEKLIHSERNSICHAIAIIIRELLKRKEVTVYPPESHPNRVGRKYCYLSLSYRKQPNHKTGLKIFWDIQQLYGFKYILKEIEEFDLKNEVDELEIVVLERECQNKNANSENTYYFEQDHPTSTEIERFNILAQKDMPNFVKCIPLDTFFIQHFGEEEFLLFEKAVEAFNKQKESMFGYKTFFMPNEIEVEKFKNEIMTSVRRFDFKSELRNAITQLNQSGKLFYKSFHNLINNLDTLHEVCYSRFISSLRFLVLFGNEDFAESYISSEWYYYSSFETDILDKTAVAVGYLKSAEQLLYKLLRLHINDTTYSIQHGQIKDNTIQNALKNEGGKIPKHIPFVEEYEEFFDKTLGSLITFTENYKDSGLFEPGLSSDWKVFLIKYLHGYCKDDRNEHLHKDNIYSANEIRTIRNRTLLLYFILLGSFYIKDDEELKELGGDKAFSKADIMAGMFFDLSAWISSILKICHSSTSTIILSPCFDINKHTEVLCFAEIEEFDLKEQDNYVYSSDVFEYSLGDYLNTKQRCEILSTMIKHYIEIQKTLPHSVNDHKFILLLYGNGYQIIQ